MARFIRPALLAMALLALPAAARAHDPVDVSQLVARLLPTVVSISAVRLVDTPAQKGRAATTERKSAIGTGFVIDPQGLIYWNGSRVDQVTLRQYLDASVQISPEPELHFQPDPQARYEVVDSVLATIKRSSVTKLGFVGNEQYRNDF